jgi:DNA-binding winged helix-turn-helix (wHTH) protein
MEKAVADLVVSFGPYRMDLRNVQLWRGARAVKVTGKAFAVLRYLLEHPGQLVTKDDLFAAIWPQTVVSESTLASCIQELRQALRDNAKKPQYIETVHRRGYRFLPAVTTAPPVVSNQWSVVSPPPTALPRSQLATGHWQLTTPLVGRETELGQLHGWLEKALNGERQIVFVTGEAGIGKTALVEAFLAGIRQQAADNGEQENQKSKGKKQKAKIEHPTPNAQHPGFPGGSASSTTGKASPICQSWRLWVECAASRRGSD